MSLPSILLLGAGGHARACIEVIESTGAYQIAGLIGQDCEVGSTVLGYPVLANDAAIPDLAPAIGNVLIAVGQIKNAVVRTRLGQLIQELNVTMPVVVASTAHVSRHARVGAGTVIMHGATVNAGAKVGEQCIINSHALIEHDVTIGDYCHIATGAIVNGDTVVGPESFLGSGSVLRNGITVGQHCVIGMGLAVLHDLLDRSTYLGKI